jgi:uncharacterized DUF497 family protein
MKITYDPAKDARNIFKHGLSFEQAAGFEFETATYRVDTRKDYGEMRLRAFGYFEERIHCLVFVETIDGIRAISFRKANPREVKRYERETQS